MSTRGVVIGGSAATFVVAAVAGVLGNQLAADALWAWIAFGVALVAGAAITAYVAHRTTPPDPARAAQPQAAQPQAAQQGTEPATVEGPVAGGNVTMIGDYVAGHDMTFNDGAGKRGTDRR